MAELATFARPYAKAAFEYADQAALVGATGSLKAIESWATALETISQIVQQDKIQSFLKSPILLSQQKADKLVELAEIKDDKLVNFIMNLAGNNRLLLLPQISLLFNQFKLRREQQVDVHIQSAFDLKSDDQSKLSTALSRHFSSDVTIQSETDADLIGGVIIHANGSMIDASIKGRLVKFAESTNS